MRMIARAIGVPGLISETCTWRALESRMLAPLRPVMTSPCVKPARLAGELGVTSATMAPEASLRLKKWALSGRTSFIEMPR